MGFEPHQPPSKIEAVNEFTNWMRDTLEEAKSALTKAKDDMARYYNQRQTPAPVYAPGNKVYLGLGTSPGHQRVLTGIPVGILVGHMTHGSGSPVATGRRGSGYGFYGGGYPP